MRTDATRDAADRVIALLGGARRVVVLTGAGMSQESGVPTFRDAQTGLWARYDPQDLATAEAFRRHPARVFGWYLMRFRQARAVQPHAGHVALAAMAARFRSFVVVTQNVDGLHRRAGSRDVLELHGALDAFRCFDRGHPFDSERLEGIELPGSGEVTPPACPTCGSPIRPGVVWFGEELPRPVLERASQLAEECNVMLVIGTSSVVYPAAALPGVAAARGAAVVEINPDQTPLTPRADLWWPASAATALSMVGMLLEAGGGAT